MRVYDLTPTVIFVWWVRLQAQESMLAQSQTCVQELTSELRNRCLELRELRHRIQNDEKLLQVRPAKQKGNSKEVKKRENVNYY